MSNITPALPLTRISTSSQSPLCDNYITRCPPGPGPAIKISGAKRGRPRKEILPTGDGDDGTAGANSVKRQRVLITASRRKTPVVAATQSVPVVEIENDNDGGGNNVNDGVKVDKMSKGGRTKGGTKKKERGKATSKVKRVKPKAVKAATRCFFEDDDFDDDDDDDDDNDGETKAVAAVVQPKEEEVVSSSSSRRLRGSRTKIDLPESTKPPTLV